MKCRICGEEFKQPNCREFDICKSCADILFESTMDEPPEDEARLQYEEAECRAYEARGAW